MQFITAAIIFIFSSIYTLVLDYNAVSIRSFQTAMSLPLVILFFIFYRLSRIYHNRHINPLEKWLFLFWGVAFLQILILSTGGLQSPFLILIHLSMLGLCFFLSFLEAFLFLIVVFAVLCIDLSFSHELIPFLLRNFNTIVLQIISLITILPISYIISQKYHIKDWVFSMLHTKVITDEAIFANLNELIIITDAKLKILSINDAVIQTLRKSRSELLYKPIFDVIFLKDRDDNLVNIQTFFPEGNTLEKPMNKTHGFTLFKSALLQKEVSIHVENIKDMETNINQISFIISFIQDTQLAKTSSPGFIENTRVKYEALQEALKIKVFEIGPADIKLLILLIERIERDIYNAQQLKENSVTNNFSRVDIAMLSKQIVHGEENFANAFHVNVTFAILHFGIKDVTPLVAGNFTVDPLKLTGPFFTASCDAKRIENLIQKLLDICILLASTQLNSKIVVTIERGEEEIFIIKITANCPVMTENEKADLFTPNYGTLYNKTNLHLGSGLEGYLVKTIANLLSVPIIIDYILNSPSTATIIFTLNVKKNFTTLP